MIKLKMYEKVICTLGEVRYVPNLKKNLLSLGSLNTSKRKIMLECEVLKVLSGALVVTKGKKEGNLYFLHDALLKETIWFLMKIKKTRRGYDTYG